MAIVFLDSSALIKLYRPSEKGFSWLSNYVLGKQIAVSELVLIESAAILGKYYRNGQYTKKQADALYERVLIDYRGHFVIDLNVQLLQSEIQNLTMPSSLPASGNKFFVRALDAIHVVSARVVQQIALSQNPPVAFIFVTADNQLLKVAAAQGFAVENPESYP